MKFNKENMPLNKNLYNKLNRVCIFNNLKLEFKNGVIFKVADTNINFIEPHRFIIKVNDIDLNLCLYDKDIIVNVPIIKELVAEIKSNSYGRRRFEVALLSTPKHYWVSETQAIDDILNEVKISEIDNIKADESLNENEGDGSKGL